MKMTNNSHILDWIADVSAITRPEKTVWIDGSEEQLEALRRQAVDEGILRKLNEEKLPGCYLHRTDVNDVARVEDRTLICCEKEEDAGPTNHWMAPDKMREKLFGKGGICDGAMTGRTFLRFAAFDLLVHSWDLAATLGTDLEVPEALVLQADAFARHVLDPWPRDGVNFAPEAAVTPDADALGRLVAYTGRTADVPLGAASRTT